LGKLEAWHKPRNSYRVFVGKLAGGNYLEDIGVIWRKIINYNLP
jgi:hypothetical protein